MKKENFLQLLLLPFYYLFLKIPFFEEAPFLVGGGGGGAYYRSFFSGLQKIGLRLL